MEIDSVDLTHSDGGANRFGALGLLGALLSGTSMIIYFLSSYAIRNYVGFIADSLSKTVEILFK